VELRDVEPVRLAHAMIPASGSEAIGRKEMAGRILLVIAALTLLRFVAAAVLPLSADEAYYWLWSRHLASGYYDHPPAIAWVIRFGTLVFGATPFGVRVGGLLLSLLASWFVWRGGAKLFGSEEAGARACLYFNLTLMISVETLAATPDAPAASAAAGVFYALAQLHAGGRARWWLAAGVFAGLGLLSKYTALFLGAGMLVWLLLSPKARQWLFSPWPYLGGVLALLIFLPNLLWNAQHGWATFVFQFGRIAEGSFTLRFLFEFLGAQLALASPFIFVLAALALAFRARDRDSATFLLAAVIFPSALYFLIHSLHDRIQGNWPSFLYPALAMAAAEAFAHTDWRGWTAPVWRFSRMLATPAAAVMLVAIYAQALFGVIPFGRSDPLARLLAVGVDGVMNRIASNADANHAAAIVTTDYASTAWFSFYGTTGLPVIQANEEYRYLDAATPPPALLKRPLIYVVEQRLDKHGLLAASFGSVREVARFDRLRHGVPIAHYVVYRLEGWKGAALGRMP
jgi:4-amino-4-deoxy-L-arabinose transferase-like glycosyltransferase